MLFQKNFRRSTPRPLARGGHGRLTRPEREASNAGGEGRDAAGEWRERIREGGQEREWWGKGERGEGWEGKG